MSLYGIRPVAPGVNNPILEKRLTMMGVRFSGCVAFVLCLGAASSRADIVVDGVLDEPQWQLAQRFDQFVTVQPLSLEPARYKTVVRLLVGEAGLYIGFSNYQPPEVQRVRRRFPRDAFLQADRNIINIDFDGTGLSAYDFTVSSSNDRQDGVLSRESQYSKEWDGSWYSQTSDDGHVWHSEVFIPWTVAPMVDSKKSQKTIGVYFARVVYGESLRFAFPNASTSRPSFISDFQSIQVKNIKTSTLDWFPYLTSTQDLVENDSQWKAGLDMVWRPNSNQQITATINPDFGQVESDDLVVNFSAIETFFEEKRPFFTENQTLFNAKIPNGDRLVNTRRIGAASDAGDKEATDINFAAKLTGYGEQLDYGAFAVTEDDTSQSKGRDYWVTRLQGRSGELVLGHSFTYTDRPTLDRTAMLNAVDVDWRYSAGVRLTGQLLVSDITQDANEVNEFEVLNTQDQGAWVAWQYSPSDEWYQRLEALHYGDEFDMNDVGFMKRNDLEELYGETIRSYLQYPEESALLSSENKLEYGTARNIEGDRLPTWMQIKRSLFFKSTREMEFIYEYESSGFDDLITRDNGLYKAQSQSYAKIVYRSRRGEDFTFSSDFSFENEGTDAWSRRIAFDPQYYLTETFTLGASIAYQQTDEWLLWDSDSSQLATYDAEIYKFNFNIDWYPSTKQEVRVKFQWRGVTAQALTGFTLLDDGEIIESAVPVESFSLGDTALQVRYRYELQPLSDIFLVYSRGGFIENDNADQSGRDLFRDGWDGLFSDSIVAKIRYRL